MMDTISDRPQEPEHPRVPGSTDVDIRQKLAELERRISTLESQAGTS